RQFSQSRDPRHVSELRLRFVQLFFGSLGLDELAYLAAQGNHHVKQLLFGLPYLVDKKLQDRQDFAAEQDGKTEGCVQSFAGGDSHTRKISISTDIRNVRGLTAGPD